MKNKKTIIISILICTVLVVIFLIVLNSMFCLNNSHINIYPVNPYCTKCHGRDGIIQHECKNPNGKEKYCRCCGKIVLNK